MIAFFKAKKKKVFCALVCSVIIRTMRRIGVGWRWRDGGGGGGEGGVVFPSDFSVSVHASHTGGSYTVVISAFSVH